MFSNKLPITYQLAQLIRADIVRGTTPPGSRLPTEVQLATDYGVSVITVQRALKGLEEEGLIERHRGRGTFVSDLPVHLVRPKSPSALELMFSDEFNDDTEILEKKIIPTPEHLQSRFVGVDKVMLIRRVVKVEGQPWSYTKQHVLPEYGKKMTLALLKRYPMFRILRESFGLSLKNVEINLEAVTPPLEVTRLLGVDPLAPVLLFTGALYASDGRLVHVPEIYFRGDRFKFSFNMDLTAK
jgi:GntR family transcriptional regulator